MELLSKYCIHFVLQTVVTYEFVLLCPCTFIPAKSSQWIFMLVDTTTAYHSNFS
jgi:hypothetical protein